MEWHSKRHSSQKINRHNYIKNNKIENPFRLPRPTNLKHISP